MSTTQTDLTTRTGMVLSVRPAGEADAPALTAFFDRVSDEDRRFRFFAAAAHVSHDQLDALIHADHFRSESFLAFDTANGELVASALLACDNALDTAEVAVSIA
ncbi:MAG: GNAT family N-acetyltransferase, partial [Sphingomonadales bacterium]|nr:GNAT family N-acetyltransferase [Sphingomonadales bacterium]